MTGYVEQWNRTHTNGVSLALGGGGTLVGKGGRTTVVGSDHVDGAVSICTFSISGTLGDGACFLIF